MSYVRLIDLTQIDLLFLFHTVGIEPQCYHYRLAHHHYIFLNNHFLKFNKKKYASKISAHFTNIFLNQFFV